MTIYIIEFFDGSLWLPSTIPRSAGHNLEALERLTEIRARKTGLIYRVATYQRVEPAK